MRILVFSDTHKRIDDCIRAVERIEMVDMIIHAGDHASDAEDIQRLLPSIPVKYVRGNCDITKAPSELLIDAEGKRIFVTHGHMYNVKLESDYRTLRQKGQEMGAEVIVFGHTHVAYNEKFADYSVINPGSAKYGRTFGVIEVENGKTGTAVCDFGNIM